MSIAAAAAPSEEPSPATSRSWRTGGWPETSRFRSERLRRPPTGPSAVASPPDPFAIDRHLGAVGFQPGLEAMLEGGLQHREGEVIALAAEDRRQDLEERVGGRD